MTALGRFALAVSALPLLAGLGACRSPTQVSLEVSTDVPCDRFKGLTITVGHRGEVEDKGAVVVSDLALCHAGVSRLGSLVVTPSGSKDEEVTIKVVVGVDTTAIECKKPDYKGCIVARRALRFVPHEPLDLPVSMAFSCVDHPCDPDTTCVKDVGCVPATIPDSTRCKGDGCDDASLAQGHPADAGPDVLVDGTVDAGPDAPIDALPDGDGGPLVGHATAVTVGVGNGCALVEGGAVKCWGVNVYGQVGDGTTTDRPIATPTKGVPPATAISFGAEVACAILVDKTVRCWGLNEYGECGVTASFGITPPSQPVGVKDVAQLAAGFRHVCARQSDGHVTCWGSAGDGELGNGDLSATATPPTMLSLTGVQQITPTCARLGDGTVQCWGQGMSTITAVPGLTKKAIDISDATDGNVLVVLEGGDVVHARRDASGWIVSAEPIGAKIGPAKRAVGYVDRTFVLLADGSVWAYGSYGDPAPKMVTGLGPSSASDIEAASSDDYPKGLQCVLMTSGSVRCWGSDLFGGLGIGRPSLFTTPQRIPAFSGVQRVRRFEGAYSAATAAFHSDGSISAWGTSQALGFANVNVPAKLALVGTDNADLAMGEEMHHAYVVKKTSHAVADFRFGAPDTNKGLTDTSFTDFTQVLVGFDWELGVRSGGQLEFWALSDAANVDGIFGEGDAITKPKDTVVERTLPGTLAGIVGGAAPFGPYNATICGWLADGSVYCWGDNQDGVGGSAVDNEMITSPRLVPFTTPKPKIVTMTMAKRHACGVDDVHRLWCWGANDLGQLGVASPSHSNVPIQVPGIFNAVGVTCFESSTCAWLTDKTASCWGSNRFGELGDGTQVDRSSPKAVPSLVDVVSMDNSCAVHGSGGVSCWGDSYTGEVGTGVDGDVETPTDVLGL